MDKSMCNANLSDTSFLKIFALSLDAKGYLCWKRGSLSLESRGHPLDTSELSTMATVTWRPRQMEQCVQAF